jgi:hypothetical protein
MGPMDFDLVYVCLRTKFPLLMDELILLWFGPEFGKMKHIHLHVFPYMMEGEKT